MRHVARQKEKANTSVSELVQAVKRPRSLSESANRPFIRKSTSGGGGENDHAADKAKAGKPLRRKSESVDSSFRRKSHAGDDRTSMQRITELPEKKHTSFRRRSFMGYGSFLMFSFSCSTLQVLFLLFFV